MIKADGFGCSTGPMLESTERGSQGAAGGLGQQGEVGQEGEVAGRGTDLGDKNEELN